MDGNKMDRLGFLKGVGALAAMSFVSPTLAHADSTTVGEKLKNLPSLPPLETDVIVVGAGPSGIPAAIAAARKGARVILLEEDQMAGGAPVDMYVALVCGGPRVGIYREMIQRLNLNWRSSGSPVEDFGKDGLNGRSTWFLPSSYAIMVHEMIAEERNITLMCGAHVQHVILKESGIRNKLEGVSIYRNGHRQDIKASVTIDATGTGLIGELSGAPSMYGRDGRSMFNEPFGEEFPDAANVQYLTWQFLTQSLRPADLSHRNKLRWKGMVEDNYGWIKAHDQERMAGLFLHWGGNFYCKDTRDPVELAKTQAEALESLRPDFSVYQQAGYMVHLAPKIGVREVRRIKGEYVITIKDLLEGKQPDGTVAICNYGFDLKNEKLTEEQRKSARPYGIPYGALVPLNVEGLLIAGKSISTSHMAQGSYRVQPIVASIGQAAGTAAAMAALNKTSTRSIELSKLIATLDRDGLFEGNKIKK
ncbi:MAG: FAD-dependent oxidoreductase [Bacteroidales bacterium]|nr:FAD-dependent oxidoreductase [Bacteroidales bacterium]